MNVVFEYFRKSAEKIQVSINYDKDNGQFTYRPTHMNYRSRLTYS